MRILLDTSFAARGPSGTGVYVERIAEALRAADVDVVEAANTNRRAPAGGGLGSVRNLGSDLRWVRRELRERARHEGVDVIHHPLPAFTPRASCPQVITVHDLAFARAPELFARAYREYATRTHRHAARNAAAVVCVSQATADDVVELWAVDPARIVVAHHGPGQELPEVAAREPTHFLYVGDDEPRKNLGLLFEAYRRYREQREDALPLVVAGSIDASPRGVELVVRPDAQRLAELYAGAVALVHPARLEGFGLTPLEAMGAGTPVVAARSAAVHEVCADAAVYVDPDDPDDLAARLALLQGDAAVRARLAEAGRTRASRFTWEHSAAAHERAYTLALEMQGKPHTHR
jgi:glycosyltransferase involved in cell wall biosynthesis